MKNILLLVLVLVATSSFAVDSRFDSAHVTVLDAELTGGSMETDSEDEAEINDEMLYQLFFMVGAYNGSGGTPDLAHVDITKTLVARDGAKKRFEYSAKFHIGWPKGMSYPAVMTLPMPYRGDEAGRKEFFQRYSKTCSEDPNDPDLYWGSFYYYYRPQNVKCKLKTGTGPYAVFPTVKIGVSPENTQGKSPEYGKVWEDNEFRATVIIGSYDSGATDNNDAGIWQFNQFYVQLLNRFGTPSASNIQLAQGQLPGMANPDVELTFDLKNGRKVNINLLLVDKFGLINPTAAFSARYNARTEKSDFISYNGHSGFGENIRALAKLGNFQKDQYQLFYINGCDTFAYVDDSLSDAHMAVNPGTDRYKFFDIITNTMPSPFNGFINSNMAVINAMVASNATYKGILSQFTTMQKAVVMGEEDNLWPQPFTW